MALQIPCGAASQQMTSACVHSHRYVVRMLYCMHYASDIPWTHDVNICLTKYVAINILILVMMYRMCIHYGHYALLSCTTKYVPCNHCIHYIAPQLVILIWYVLQTREGIPRTLFNTVMPASASSSGTHILLNPKMKSIFVIQVFFCCRCC